MPVLRSQRQKDDKIDKVVKMKTVHEPNQWVMIAPDKLIDDGDVDTFLHKMPHPQNGVVSLFMFKNKDVYQVMQCKEDYRSWFVDESVQKDGSMYMITPIDPLFLALPYLEKSAAQNIFTTLDNILTDENHPEALIKLEQCLTKKNLLNICNCKGSEDIVAYKSDESRILAWLSLKIHKLADHLSSTALNVGLGVKVKNFVHVDRDLKQKEEDCKRYAWTMVSDYLPAHWVDKLKENLDIKDLVKQPVKKQKLNDSTASDKTPDTKTGIVEDYRDHSKAKKVAPPAKLTSAQKLIQKVDKKGMKTMNSFFTSKPKK